jgi:DNA invertase Pin-like site-specific DNA recombinase
MPRRSNNTTNIEVPTHMMDRVMEVMNAMTVEDDTNMVDESPAPAPPASKKKKNDDKYEIGHIVTEETRGGKHGYVVHWKGYSSSEDTWEPEENLEGCEDYIQEWRERRDQDQNIGDDELHKVRKILSHKVTRGVWSFKIQWENGKPPTWENDVDCNCEILIRTSISLEAQEEEIKKGLVGAEYRGMRFKVFKISESAYKGIPQTLRMIGEVCKKGDAIHIWRVDRLSRNIVLYLDWCRDLDQRGVELKSYQEGITYKNNRLLFIQSILDATKEAELLGHRVKLANKRKGDRGDEAIGNLHYGKKYKVITNQDGSIHHKEVVTNDEEQDIIDTIRTTRFTGKTTYQSLADRFNLQNKLKRGRMWSKDMIKTIAQRK